MPSHDSPVMFLQFGVFMYLAPDQVLDIFQNAKEHFPGCEFVFDTILQDNSFFTMNFNVYLKKNKLTLATLKKERIHDDSMLRWTLDYPTQNPLAELGEMEYWKRYSMDREYFL